MVEWSGIDRRVVVIALAVTLLVGAGISYAADSMEVKADAES
ncbi:MAG: hypothetical protein SVU32_00770 [Candidatus Nanohaloarchaea archaeon]|nr:hypothetical protein [Candidatus Nanohaloarchaea archaeon]